MSELDRQAREAAESVAAKLTERARRSGDEPVVFVTGNSYFPPLRSFPEFEALWQEEYASGDAFGFAVEILEDALNEADVYMGDTVYDGSLYVVDTARFEYDEQIDVEDYRETLSDEWMAK
jgi:hypothetical protein